MRRLEETGRIAHSRMAPGDPNDPESFKTRRGEIGGYLGYLSPGQIASMDAYMAEHLDPVFGY
jgi:hypothetical protein